MRRAILAFFPAVLAAYLVASLLATQTILHRLGEMGMPVTLREHVQASLHDLVGLLTSYLPLILLAFLLALPIAAGLSRLLPRLRVVFFTLAGALAVICIHLIMRQVLGLNGIAATRETPGLLLQGGAGFFGGYLFYVLMGWAHR
jgi:hypothetical protein